MSTKEQLREVLSKNTLQAVLSTLCQMIDDDGAKFPAASYGLSGRDHEETLRHLRNAHLAALNSEE